MTLEEAYDIFESYLENGKLYQTQNYEQLSKAKKLIQNELKKEMGNINEQRKNNSKNTKKKKTNSSA